MIAERPRWAAYHARHTRAITWVVAVRGWRRAGRRRVCCCGRPAGRPAGGGLAASLGLAVLALVTVAATLGSAVAWTASAVAAAVLLARAP